MSKFKIVAGDFPKNATLFSMVGPVTLYSRGDRLANLTTELQSVEAISEENKKKIVGATGWGITGAVLGGLIAGPVGLAAGLAGVLKGGNSKEVCLVCHLKDGRKFMAIVDGKTYQKLLALTFNSAP